MAAIAGVVTATGAAARRSGLDAPQPTLLLTDRHDRHLDELVRQGDGNLIGRGFWPIEPSAERVFAAIVAIEDHRFWQHPGVDPIAVARAAIDNTRTGRRVSGASTLAMQIARMQEPSPRTYAHKVVEALTAVALTLRHGRETILRHYLRIAPFGNRVRGIEYAARVYFEKPAADLSWAEIALLCAVPKSPTRMNLYRPAGRIQAERRGRQILDLLLAAGVVPEPEHAVATRQIGQLEIADRHMRPGFAMHAILRARALAADKQVDLRRPIVRTSLDLELQRRVTTIATNALYRWRDRGAGNAAIIAVDRESREVLAYAGSADYFDDDSSGAIDYARAPRSSGSTLKPFLYGLALDRAEITPAAVLDDLHPGPGGITNSDRRFLGPLLPRVALANSRNVPVIEMIQRVGLVRSHEYLRQLNLHDGSRTASHYGFGLAVGTLPVTLNDLVRAYTGLANGGLQGELAWFVGAKGHGQRVMSEDSARIVTQFLADPLARLPTFPRMGSSEYPFPVAIKTGTSQGFRDAWAVGYSARYVVGAWVGHPDNHPMNRLSGSGGGARLLQSVLKDLHRNQLRGFDDVSFPAPRNHVSVRLCAHTGRLATPACERAHPEWFRPGEAPVESCTAHRRVEVEQPAGETETRTLVDLGPRYAVWQATWGRARARPLKRRTATPGKATHHAPPRLQISRPRNGARIMRDPELPAALATLALEAVAEPAATQLLWYVDGRPLELVDHPYQTRWTLASGEHVFVAEDPSSGARTAPVTVTVQ